MQNPYPDKSRKRRAFVSAAGYGVLNLAVAVWGRLTDEGVGLCFGKSGSI